MLKIFIADDHSGVRHGIKELLKEEYSSAVFGEASNGLDALEKAKHEDWDLLILDVSMPGKTGVEVLKQLRRDSIGTPVLIISLENSPLYATAALKAGAADYLCKPNISEGLISSINRILKDSKV